MLDHSVTYNPITILELGFDEAYDVLYHPAMLETEWVDYPGDYVKHFYDVELNDGTIMENVWPNAGMWNGHDNSEVKRVRFSPNPYPWRTKESNDG